MTSSCNWPLHSPHATDALVPALDHPSHSQLEDDGLVAVQAAVKLGAIGEGTLQPRTTAAQIPEALRPG